MVFDKQEFGLTSYGAEIFVANEPLAPPCSDIRYSRTYPKKTNFETNLLHSKTPQRLCGVTATDG